MLGWVPTSHGAAFHFCRTILPFPCPFPMFPSCCLRAGLKSWKEAVSVPSQRSLKVFTRLWASLCLVQGSPLEKNQHCPRCVPSLEPIYPVGTQPQQGIISWVSVPPRLTRCSWLCSSGGVSPSTFFLTSPWTLFCVSAVFCPSHPCA